MLTQDKEQKKTDGINTQDGKEQVRQLWQPRKQELKRPDLFFNYYYWTFSGNTRQKNIKIKVHEQRHRGIGTVTTYSVNITWGRITETVFVLSLKLIKH